MSCMNAHPPTTRPKPTLYVVRIFCINVNAVADIATAIANFVYAKLSLLAYVVDANVLY